MDFAVVVLACMKSGQGCGRILR